MVTITDTIMITGSSEVIIGDEKVFVASLSATINGSDINITKTISNKEAFDAHKEEVQKDFAEFEEYVYAHER